MNKKEESMVDNKVACMRVCYTDAKHTCVECKHAVYVPLYNPDGPCCDHEKCECFKERCDFTPRKPYADPLTEALHRSVT